MTQRFSLALLVMTSCCSLICGCARQKPVPTREVVLQGVKFELPIAYSVDESSGKNGVSYFEFEGIPGEIRDGKLAVFGKDYGPVVPGDLVTFHSDGSFLINGKQREAAGLSDSTIESDGVLFLFSLIIQNQVIDQDGIVSIEDSSGLRYKIANGELIIDDFTYGPYIKGNVVKVSNGGKVTLYP